MIPPLQLRAGAGALAEQAVDALIVFVRRDGGLGPAGRAVDAALGGWLQEMLAAEEFRGDAYSVAVIPTGGRLPARRVALVGLGKGKEYSLGVWRRAVAAAVIQLQERRLGRAALDVAESELPAADAARAAVEGAEYARFDPGLLRGDEGRLVPLAELTVVGAPEEALAHGEIVGRAKNLARELTHLPPNDLSPEALARHARDVAARLVPLECEVLGPEEMRALGMGAILAVAQGSARIPQLIVLRYPGRGDGPTLALVGKAVTFDTGGISLKAAAGMEAMKSDMAGGAAVLGAMQAICELRIPLQVVGLVPAAENMPSGTAWRPADVIRTMSGKTVETISTDAEGRMLLADALTYAQRRCGATHLADIATLTGACLVALGRVASGLYGTDRELIDAVVACGEAAGEIHWPMPLFPEYREQLKSDNAAFKNSGGREAGSVTAAWFLREFVEEGRPWVHLDVAGTARQEQSKPYGPAGPTGVGVGTFVHLAQWLAARAG